MPLKINRVRIKNFQSIDDADLELPTRGLIVVKGINNSGPGVDSIGSGKTALGEAIYTALLGVRGKYKGGSLSKYASKKSNFKNMLVQLTCDLDGVPLLIWSGYKCPEVKTTGEGLRFKLGDGPWMDGRGSVETTRKELNAILGVTSDIAEKTIFLDGKKLDFSVLSERDLVSLFLFLINDTNWTSIQDKVKKELEEANGIKAKIESEMGIYTKDLSSIDSNLESLKSKKQKLEEEFKQKDSSRKDSIGRYETYMKQDEDALKEAEKNKSDADDALKKQEEAKTKNEARIKEASATILKNKEAATAHSFSLKSSLDVLAAELNGCKEKQRSIDKERSGVVSLIDRNNRDRKSIVDEISRVKKDLFKLDEDIKAANISLEKLDVQIKESENSKDKPHSEVIKCKLCDSILNETNHQIMKEKLKAELLSKKDTIVNSIKSFNEKKHQFNDALLTKEKSILELDELSIKYENEKRLIKDVDTTLLTNRYNEKKHDLDKANKEVEGFNDQLKAIERDSTYLDIVKEIDSLKRRIDTLSYTIKEKSTSLATNDKRRAELLATTTDKTELTVIDTKIESNSAKANELQATISKYEADRSRINTYKHILEYWYVGYGPTGISNMLIKESLPYINHIAEHISKSLTGGLINISFDASRTLAKGTEVNEMVIALKNANGAPTLEGSSKGESGIANLIVAETLYNIGRIHTKIGSIWRDEVLTSQDTRVCKSSYEFFKKQANDYGIASFIVDHNLAIEPYADWIITATKSSTGATTFKVTR